MWQSQTFTVIMYTDTTNKSYTSRLAGIFKKIIAHVNNQIIATTMSEYHSV